MFFNYISVFSFATGCEISEDGYKIHCTCREGYTGAKCQSCASGFYGRPEIEGEFCRPCDCSGNINLKEPGSCDSVSGDCLRCLNNTSGHACNLCAPGFYGDAIKLKNCQSKYIFLIALEKKIILNTVLLITGCICDPLGTEHCDSFVGTCHCHQNVIGKLKSNIITRDYCF